jgi:hypothetical protein
LVAARAASIGLTGEHQKYRDNVERLNGPATHFGAPAGIDGSAAGVAFVRVSIQNSILRKEETCVEHYFPRCCFSWELHS